MVIVPTYGAQQRFRYRSEDLNFIGRVEGARYPVKNAHYRLNGAAPVDFYLEQVPDPGIDWTYEYKNSSAVNRLKDLGDFNIEVPCASAALRAGANHLLIRIEDAGGPVAEREIAFSWEPAPLALPLDLTDLTRFNRVQELGQVVDGAFDLDRDQNLLRTRAPVYPDSLLVLGSPQASQEATYKVRFTDFTNCKWVGPSVEPETHTLWPAAPLDTPSKI